MAKVVVVFHNAGNRSLEGGSMPVARLTGARAEVLTSGSTSVATQGVARDVVDDPFGGSNADGGFATVLASGGNVWVKAGAAPVAAVPGAGVVGSGFPVAAGVPVTFAVARGDKIAVIDWTA